MDTADGRRRIDELSDDALTGRFRVWQRRGGHRYSLDDVVTAWEAVAARPDATRYLDLGCGVGSVLLMVAYKLPGAQCVGVEAQPLSIELARRNVARNGVAGRAVLDLGDLRDRAQMDGLTVDYGPFDLVTGTPPYQRAGASTPSPDPQRRYARVELRGGVEAYVEAAAAALAPGGALVVCADARTPERALGAARACGLRPLRRRDVIPRAGVKGPLFTVWTFEKPRRDERAAGPEATPLVEEPFVARTASGDRSEAYLALRAFFDLPPVAAPGRDDASGDDDAEPGDGSPARAVTTGVRRKKP
ncbi:MAG: methyltransferase [Myxococcales bacterium]|nr:methyltransferase [Myxococcales bacterium]